MPRLPIPGGDENSWGKILNEYLAQAHNTDGSLKTSAVDAAKPHASAVTFDGSSSGLSASSMQDALDETVGLLMQEGTLAARPAASAAGNRALYYATDDSGGTLYRSNGTSWQQVGAPVDQTGGAQLGSATLTANYSNQSETGQTAIPGMSITVNVGSRPIAIHIDGAMQIGGTSSETNAIGPLLKRNGNNVNAFVSPPPVRAAGTEVLFLASFRQVEVLSAGSYTYTLHIDAGSAAKYINFLAGLTGFYPPFRLSAMEL